MAAMTSVSHAPTPRLCLAQDRTTIRRLHVCRSSLDRRAPTSEDDVSLGKAAPTSPKTILGPEKPSLIVDHPRTLSGNDIHARVRYGESMGQKETRESLQRHLPCESRSVTAYGTVLRWMAKSRYTTLAYARRGRVVGWEP